MNDETIGKASLTTGRTDWNRLRGKSDAEVHRSLVADPGILPTNEAFWETANVVMPRRKEPITLRLDADLLAWLRQDRGYQTRINAVLRTYMQAQLRK
jgi:uncharacterized protein (DUF4415 family)